MTLYDLQITVEEIKDGGDYRYLATSPDLPNLILTGETIEEVLPQAPHVAEALIAPMQAAGDALSTTLRTVRTLPFASHVAVPVN